MGNLTWLPKGSEAHSDQLNSAQGADNNNSKSQIYPSTSCTECQTLE